MMTSTRQRRRLSGLLIRRRAMRLPGEPQVVDALGYQGWLDGQASVGSFNALLNWRKDDQCTVTLCDNAADPAACRATSTDIFGEINTACVGVADGFMGYNHQS